MSTDMKMGCNGSNLQVVKKTIERRKRWYTQNVDAELIAQEII